MFLSARCGSGDAPGEVSGDGERRQVLADVVLLQDVHVAADAAIEGAAPGVLDPLAEGWQRKRRVEGDGEIER